MPQQILHCEVISDLSESPDIAAEQDFKTLVIALPGELAVAIVPVPSRLSLKAAAARHFPCGQRTRLQTVVDSSASRWDGGAVQRR